MTYVRTFFRDTIVLNNAVKSPSCVWKDSRRAMSSSLRGR